MVGSVPLVDYNAKMLSLYDGLPVVQVKDWATITPAYLESERARIQKGVLAGEFSMDRAFLPYWLRRTEAASLCTGTFCDASTIDVLERTLP
jgi:hypothetical protein